MVKQLGIIGAGKLGRSLGRLLFEAGRYQIASVINSTPSSAESAITFMGAGTAASNFSSMSKSDAILIATQDAMIEPTCKHLVDAVPNLEGKIIWHASGCLSSAVLSSAKAAGAWVASVHPIFSFANPSSAVDQFHGTYCGVEGDEEAIRTLSDDFDAIGGDFVAIVAEKKTLYHAGAVFASNYLIALLQTSTDLYMKAGISKQDSIRLIQPIAKSTLDHFAQFGAVEALTGPIARGEFAVVQRQILELDKSTDRSVSLYRELGAKAVDIATAKEGVDRAVLEQMRELLLDM